MTMSKNTKKKFAHFSKEQQRGKIGLSKSGGARLWTVVFYHLQISKCHLVYLRIKTEKEKWCSMAGYRPSMKHN